MVMIDGLSSTISTSKTVEITAFDVDSYLFASDLLRILTTFSSMNLD
jgi:hypothetical protein